ncbi:hypothetical protein Poli38472_000278 [Pythium oligandrum]|uniref:Uncharacterized protein n=1 Tax=Pythium oligandrum TaxID=41045 RepID=A0A8K1CC57_PYTOL|nr:hypothetical protein Poli38472_000278 [Pythium oligandrum]|eukprot:TMW60236.1 hypothetical protein Poli38472_000278 [Pythium oligandrum]
MASSTCIADSTDSVSMVATPQLDALPPSGATLAASTPTPAPRRRGRPVKNRAVLTDTTQPQPQTEPTSEPARRSGRERKRAEPVNFDFGLTAADRREQKLLKLALARSVVETQLTQTAECPSACVFYPTEEEFASPMAYIASIQQLAARTGICKIVPPPGWKPAFAIDFEGSNVQFETRLQNIHKLQEGVDYEDGRQHTFATYRAAADTFRKQWFSAQGYDPDTITSAQIEQEYWRIVETGGPAVQVEYANDLDTTQVGSGFPRATNPFAAVAKGKESVDFFDPKYYEHTAWNLNNLPFAHGSLLRHMHTAINGINVPWLYCGMLFATFSWHTEDNYMYSVNYQHVGAKKRWYGIPATHSFGFEKVLKQRLSERFRESPDLLFHLTTMVSPAVLASHGVEVYTLIQEPGDIVLTFPRGYHAGFSEGFNCNEACNFVLPSWIQFGRESIERYREVGRSSIFSHDRFIFHFGSTQSLEEYTAEECEMLLKELRMMFQEEQRLKRELEVVGLEHVLELSADVMLDDKNMQIDEVRECFHCKHNVFFSGIICACMPTRISCLRHVKYMCRCTMGDRTLIQWVGPADIRYAIRRVQVKIQTLKKLALGGLESIQTKDEPKIDSHESHDSEDTSETSVEQTYLVVKAEKPEVLQKATPAPVAGG